MNDLQRIPFHVVAHSSADALDVAKAEAKRTGWVVWGVSRVELLDADRDHWVVFLSVRAKEVAVE